MKTCSLALIQSVALLIGSVHADDPIPTQPQRIGVRTILGTLVDDDRLELTTKKPDDDAEPEMHLAIGVVVDPLQEGVSSHLGLEAGHGLLVREVLEKSAAEEAGVKQYDILIQIGDVQLEELSDLVDQVRGGKGEPVQLTWLRAGEKQSAEVTPRLMEFPAANSELDADGLTTDLLVITSPRSFLVGNTTELAAPPLYQPMAAEELKSRIDRIEEQLAKITQLLEAKASEASK